MIFETNNRKVPYPKRGLTVSERAWGVRGARALCLGANFPQSFTCRMFMPVYSPIVSDKVRSLKSS